MLLVKELKLILLPFTVNAENENMNNALFVYMREFKMQDQFSSSLFSFFSVSVSVVFIVVFMLGLNRERRPYYK